MLMCGYNHHHHHVHSQQFMTVFNHMLVLNVILYLNP